MQVMDPDGNHSKVRAAPDRSGLPVRPIVVELRRGEDVAKIAKKLRELAAQTEAL
jgi:hypothetical protein